SCATHWPIARIDQVNRNCATSRWYWAPSSRRSGNTRATSTPFGSPNVDAEQEKYGQMERVMTPAANKAIFRRIYAAAWNTSDLTLVDTLLAVDFVNHELPVGIPSQRDLYKQAITETRAAFADWRNSIEEMIVEGVPVAARRHATGTRTGPGI